MALLMVKMIGRIWYWPFPPQGPSFCRQISIRYLEILWQKWGKTSAVMRKFSVHLICPIQESAIPLTLVGCECQT